MLDYQARAKIAKTTQANDRWRHRKTGNIVVVIGRKGRFDVLLRHESGRETSKQDHYLASDYEPVNQDAQVD